MFKGAFMNRSVPAFPRSIGGMGCLVLSAFALVAPSLHAQTSIQLFAPVNKRASVTGTGYGTAAVNFNSSTLNLTCSASPIVAMLSSAPDNSANLLVDNNINVSVTPAGGGTTGPTNVCVGGVNGSAIGIPFQNCFTTTYEIPAAGVSYDGLDPDTYVATGGVAPFSIASLLVPGNETVTIALQDEGFSLASSTLYLNTNCTQNGVTGPALVTGNVISGTNPTPGQVNQDFSFNPLLGQQIGFEYDLSAALAANSLTITDGTIPQVGDMPLDPAIFSSQYAPGTSFATSACLIHGGEVLANGNPACKLYTLECTVGTGASASGAQCPVSEVANEIFSDVFDGPGFTLPDLITPNGTFHQGIGLIMANEGWGGGPCLFDAAANLGSTDCPQNLLTSFSSVPTGTTPAVKKAASLAPKAQALGQPKAMITGGGSGSTYSGTGQTTRPNSTFLSIAQIPEPLTTMSLLNGHPGNWINGSTADVSFSTEPPNLTGTNIPGAAGFVPSPILSLTYGISTAASVPAPGTSLPNDTVAANSVGCPSATTPTTPAATLFTPQPTTFSGLTNGQYLVHYYAQDCAGTQELKFAQDGNGNWSTNFFTAPINVDTVPPVVTQPTISIGTYTVGQVVYATYSCSDALSGIVTCGSHTYAVGATNSTGAVTTPLDTTSPGTKTFMAQAVDAAGNTASASVQYQVVSSFDSQIQISFNANPITFPNSTVVTVKTLPVAGPNHRATGTVGLYLDGSLLLGTLPLGGAGNGYSAAYYTPTALNAGVHGVTAVYAGDAYNAGGTSTPVTLTVLPTPVTLKTSCVNPSIPSGANFTCNVFTQPLAAGSPGTVTYTVDNGLPTTLTLSGGTAAFTLTKPAIGTHTVVIAYASQPNYAAPAAQTINFKVTAPSH
jgi:Bacterial Ig-like domain (group 3)